jgi:hypothetical protein
MSVQSTARDRREALPAMYFMMARRVGCLLLRRVYFLAPKFVASSGRGIDW